MPVSGGLVPRVYFKKGISGTWYSQPGSLSSGTATNGVWSFTINAAVLGGLVANDVVYYYIIAQDIVSTPNISSNPTGVVATNVNTVTTHPAAPNSFVIGSVLSGNYTVGSGGAFGTLTAAVNNYNVGCGISGPVTFSLTDATYSANETFPIVINANSAASATNTLTIKPATGVSTTISGSSAIAVIQLNGADYVKIDGSNNGTNSKNMTISNSSTSTTGTVVWIGSASATDGATNDTVRNIITQGQAPLTTFVGIFCGSGTTVGGTAESPNNNVAILNNTCQRSQYGIAVPGFAGQTGNIISGNTIGSATAADYIGFIGMFASNNSGIQITNNTIFNIITSANNPTGINIAAGVLNSTISGNNIASIRYTGISGYGGKGMNINTGSATSNLNIFNNFISDMGGDGWSSLLSDAIIGVRIGANASTTTTTGGINFYNNTINLGSGAFAGNTSGTVSAGLYLSSTATGLNIRNNVIHTNLVNSAATTAKTYAIYSAATNTAYTAIDYNDYAVTGTQGVLGYIGSDRTDLTAIQTGFGSNANSKNIVPVFNSATDLHLSATSNTTLDNLGTPIAGIVVDIDNQNRSTTTPDMGADEFGAPLPIKFEYLTGKKAASTNALNWKVTCTSTSITMVLERSADARTFNQVITTINATQARCGQPFDAVDASPINGISYYRLKMIDVDGKVSYSPVAAVINGKAGAELVGIYPTVVKDQAYLSVTSSRNITMQLSISDMSGKLLKTINQPVISGSSLLPVNTSSLASGVYNITGILDGIRTQTLRFVKQ